jgi:hypothetical protein
MAGNNGNSQTTGSDALASTQPGDIVGGTVAASTPPRLVSPVLGHGRLASSQNRTQAIVDYTGSNRITADNQFDIDPRTGQPLAKYDELVDAESILSGLDAQDRQILLGEVAKGLGGTANYKPSRLGIEDTDIKAMSLILRQANTMGRTYDVALDYMVSNFGKYATGTGAGKKIAVDSPDDINPITDQLSLKYLGRILSPEVKANIVKTIQDQTVAYANASGTAVQPATLTNAVTQQVLSADPKEAEVQGAATLGEWFQKSLGA